MYCVVGLCVVSSSILFFCCWTHVQTWNRLVSPVAVFLYDDMVTPDKLVGLGWDGGPTHVSCTIAYCLMSLRSGIEVGRRQLSDRLAHNSSHSLTLTRYWNCIQINELRLSRATMKAFFILDLKKYINYKTLCNCVIRGFNLSSDLVCGARSRPRCPKPTRLLKELFN